MNGTQAGAARTLLRYRRLGVLLPNGHDPCGLLLEAVHRVGESPGPNKHVQGDLERSHGMVHYLKWVIPCRGLRLSYVPWREAG